MKQFLFICLFVSLVSNCFSGTKIDNTNNYVFGKSVSFSNEVIIAGEFRTNWPVDGAYGSNTSIYASNGVDALFLLTNGWNLGFAQASFASNLAVLISGETNNYALLDGGNQPFTGNLVVSNSSPQIKGMNSSIPSWWRQAEETNKVSFYRKNFEVFTNYPTFVSPTNSIAAYYFENTNTSTIVNWSSGGTNSAVLDTYAPTPVNISGMVNAYKFDGNMTNMYIAGSENYPLDAAKPYTLAVWYKGDVSGYGFWIAKFYGSGVQFQYNGNEAQFLMAGPVWNCTAPAPTDGKWHRYVAVNPALTSSDLKIYVDGTNKTDGTSGGSMPVNVVSTLVRIGARQTPPTQGAVGQIFLPVIATSVWSSAYILADFQNTNPTNFLSVIPPGGAVITTNSNEQTVWKSETGKDSTDGTNTFGTSNAKLRLLGLDLLFNGNPIEPYGIWSSNEAVRIAGTTNALYISSTNDSYTLAKLLTNGYWNLTDGTNWVNLNYYPLVGNPSGFLTNESILLANSNFWTLGSIAGTNAQSSVAVLVTNTISPGQTSGWVVVSHSGLATNAGGAGAGYYSMSNGVWTAFSTIAGSGDFKADGSVAMTGPFNGGGQAVTNVSGVNITSNLPTLTLGWPLVSNPRVRLFQPVTNSSRFDLSANMSYNGSWSLDNTNYYGSLITFADGAFSVRRAVPTTGTPSLVTSLYTTSDGKVGIGTQVPTTNLDVNGGIRTTNLYVSGNAADTPFQAYSSGGSSYDAIMGILTSNNYDLVFQRVGLNIGEIQASESLFTLMSSGTNTLRIIDSNGNGLYMPYGGNVGIGINTNLTGPANRMIIAAGVGNSLPAFNGQTPLIVTGTNGNGNVNVEILGDTTNAILGYSFGNPNGAQRAMLRYNGPTDRIYFQTTAGETLTALPNGNVGIRTNNPSVPLEVVSTALASDTVKILGNGASSKIVFRNSASTNMLMQVFNNAGTERGRFDPNSTSDGCWTLSRFGVGVAVPNSSLHVVQPDTVDNAGIIMSGSRNLNSLGILFKNSYWNANDTNGMAYIRGLDTGNSGGELAFGTTLNGSLQGGAPTERMRINNAGRVGLNVVAPVSSLHVHNTSATTSTITMTDNGISTTYGGYISGYGIQMQGGFLELGSWGNSTKIPAITVNHVGNVGVGTIAPVVPLHAFKADPSAENGIVGYFQRQGAGDVGICFSQSGVDSFSIVNKLGTGLAFIQNRYAGGAGTEVVRITAQGAVGIGTNAPVSYLHVLDPGGGTAGLIVGNGSPYDATANQGGMVVDLYSDGNMYNDYKTWGGNLYFRCGNGAERCYARNWLTVATATGNATFGGVISGNGSGVTNVYDHVIANQNLAGGLGAALNYYYYGAVWDINCADTDAQLSSSFYVRNGGTFQLYMVWYLERTTGTAGGCPLHLYTMTCADAEANDSWNINNATDVTLSLGTTRMLTSVTALGSPFSVSNNSRVGTTIAKVDTAAGFPGILKISGFVLVRQ